MAVRQHLKPLFLATSALTLLVACSEETNTANEAAPVSEPTTTARPVDQAAVITHYADLAQATYQDALTTAQHLRNAVEALIANPSDETLDAARNAWLAARVPYQQSEVFRFGNAVVDDWEGQLNAWPLDEGLIDYVANDAYQYELGNDGATVNIVANTEINVGGQTVDVSTLSPELLADLNEIGGSEANVATGYHAVEFLLWGQDLNGFEAGAGNRSATDFAAGDACTNGNCERRAAYLEAASELLVQDLEWMVAQWSPSTTTNYRHELTSMATTEVFQKMLFGMGSLSLGELAGERMKVALEANSYEDEHDCFSDNTHNSHYYNGKGIENVYTGTYTRVDGTVLSGPSLSALVAETNPVLDAELTQQLQASMAALGQIKAAAEASDNPTKFDMMIAPANTSGAELINNAIAALVAQTANIEKAARIVGVESLQPDDAGHTF
ncbi:imelysin family protein [Marinobacter zhejiangensis]|uniref:Putative iron-regulated protein n=1 Tax=Marinobacter zhejiangensis TaxID=488535 RepID=A0A1I4QE82_9GAMM|nr:imelysin family protein [Marinobacter zhejiangensis]SFM38422.1 putative iron-regulated protein [Marinobacter zhejiangensis]